MKKLKKILKITLISFLSLILVIFGLLAWVLYNPRPAFEMAEKYFLPEDLKITWQKWDLHTKRLDGFDLFINWKIEDLLIVKEKPYLRIPIQTIQLKASIQPFKKHALLEHFIVVANSKIEFQASDEKKKTEEPPKNIFQTLQTLISLLETIHDRVNYQTIDIQVSEFVLLNKTAAPLVAQIKISSAEGGSAIFFDSVVKRDGVGHFHASVKGQLDPMDMKSDKAFLSSEIQFQGFKTEVKQNLSAKFMSNTATFMSEGSVTYALEKFKVLSEPKLSLIIDKSISKLEIVTDVNGLPGPISKINNMKLTLNTPLDESVLWSEKPSDFSLVAPIEMKFLQGAVKAQLQKSCDCQFPISLLAKMSGKMWLALLFTENTELKTFLESDISLENYKNKIFSLDLAGTLRIDRDKTQWKLFPELNCRASIYDFQGLRPVFEMYKVMIPAPLDVLNGTVNFYAQGPISTDEKGSQFPAKLDIDLKSKRQIVKLNNLATVLLSPDFKKVHVQTMTKIQDFQVELPPLNPVGGKPRVTPDPRILKVPPPKAVKSAFEMSFDIQVDTLNPGAIRLLSEFFKPFLPLTLKLNLNSKNGNDGFVQTEPFDIVYLRRRVRVEKMRIDLSQTEDDVLPVDGRFRIKQTHYTIFIEVKGNAKNPNITMTSEPELPQDEIISVLLYDRVSGELASADAETAGGVQAAVADRAIGLFGLWAFASTPIKSFSYNPVTKVYTATVALGGDVTAGIGTTWESTAQLELRKRVSRQWMLTARWTAATPEEGQNTEIVLQWERRF